MLFQLLSVLTYRISDVGTRARLKTHDWGAIEVTDFGEVDSNIQLTCRVHWTHGWPFLIQTTYLKPPTMESRVDYRLIMMGGGVGGGRGQGKGG